MLIDHLHTVTDDETSVIAVNTAAVKVEETINVVGGRCANRLDGGGRNDGNVLIAIDIDEIRTGFLTVAGTINGLHAECLKSADAEQYVVIDAIAEDVPLTAVAIAIRNEGHLVLGYIRVNATLECVEFVVYIYIIAELVCAEIYAFVGSGILIENDAVLSV